ncbi:hypothetical protein DFQ27_003313 [Actinomortierella ambigua]|uniref:C3H1-type domain-containing protein n=1 Tax=Actinomortierella ambigua TaxID=1343610 RepID=A0A9P6Q8J0_9FUNG|nr:hypothetical protein DFQ27_003313 [Actinomortierella ambigua]
MSDKELLAQIAQLAGAINKHNMNIATAGGGYGYTPANARGGYSGVRGRGGPPLSFRGRGRGAINGSVHRSLTLNNNSDRSSISSSSSSSSNNNHLLTRSSLAAATPSPPQIAPSSILTGIPNGTPPTSSPVPTPRGVATWPLPPQSRPSRHLTLNVKAQHSGSTPSPSPPISSTPINTAVGPGSSVSIDKATGQQWIQSKGKNMSLMTAEKYKKTMVAKQKSIISMKKAKLKAKQARAKRLQDLRKGLVTIGDTSYAKSADGRKLVINHQQSGSILIDGIEFEMDTRGNKLVRKGLSNSSSSSSSGSSSSMAPAFTSTSTNAITTPKALSVDGVKINPKAPLCIPFAKEGWCDKGGTCKDRHAWICPDFNSKQGCHRRCGLAHVPEQGNRGQAPAQPNGQHVPLSKRARFNNYNNGNSSTLGSSEQDSGMESKSSSSTRQYDENFIPLDLASDDDDDDDGSELVLHQQISEHAEDQDQDQSLGRSVQPSELSDEVEEESEESEDVEDMDVDSDGMVSDESDDDIEDEEEEEEEEEKDQSPGHEGSVEEEDDEDDEEEDEDDYMAYYQDEEEDDRGEY